MLQSYNWITEKARNKDDFWKIFQIRRLVFDKVHVQYPLGEPCAHLGRFFRADALLEYWATCHKEEMLAEIAGSMNEWTSEEDIDFDVIFAPNQPVVRKIVEAFISARTDKETRMALWEYLPTGRFGDKLVSGEIKPGDRVLVYNAVSIQGRCIGERLPSFAEALGGEVVAIACFAKGTTPKVRELEEKWGNKFYSAIQIDIPVYKPEDCPMCKAGEKLIPWTEL